MRATGSLSGVLRYLTAGESHGPALVVVVEGVPADMALSTEDIAHELARRRLGYGRGPRMRFEQDEVTLVGGVRHGRTLGSPIAIEIANTECGIDSSDDKVAALAPIQLRRVDTVQCFGCLRVGLPG